MWKTSFKLAVISLIIICGSAFADDLFYFQNAGTLGWNGVLVNPYTAVDLSTTPNQVLTIYCDDWNTDFGGNPTWYANVFSLTDAMNNPSVLQQLKYGNTTSNYNLASDGTYSLGSSPDALYRYLEAAWLDSQVPTSDTERIELAAAVWTLFVDGGKVGPLMNAINSSPDFMTAVAQDLANAQSAVGTWDPSGWYVITPDPNDSSGNPAPQDIDKMQEFLYHDSPSVPEPSGVILLGTVIGYLGFIKFRRQRQA